KEDPLVLRGGWTDEEVRRLARVASGEAERLLHRDPPVVANERELLSGQDLRPVERPDEGSAIHGDARGPRRRHAEEQRERHATWLKIDPLEPDLYLWIAGRRLPPGTGLVAENRDGAMRPLLLMAHGPEHGRELDPEEGGCRNADHEWRDRPQLVPEPGVGESLEGWGDDPPAPLAR